MKRTAYHSVPPVALVSVAVLMAMTPGAQLPTAAAPALPMQAVEAILELDRPGQAAQKWLASVSQSVSKLHGQMPVLVRPTHWKPDATAQPVSLVFFVDQIQFPPQPPLRRHLVDLPPPIA